MTKERVRLMGDLVCTTAEFINRFNDTRANMRTDETMAYERMLSAYMACQNAEVEETLKKEEKEDGR